MFVVGSTRASRIYERSEASWGWGLLRATFTRGHAPISMGHRMLGTQLHSLNALLA